MKFFAQRVQRSMDQLRWMGLKGQWSDSAEKMPESAFGFRQAPLEAVSQALENELGPFLRQLEKARIEQVSFGRSQNSAFNGGEAVALLRAPKSSGERLRERVTIASYMQELSANAARAPLAETFLCDALASLKQDEKTGQWRFECLPERRVALLRAVGGAEGVVEALRLASLRVQASGQVEKRVGQMRDLRQWRGQGEAASDFWGGVGNTIHKQTMRKTS